jgi:hypothetical protein
MVASTLAVLLCSVQKLLEIYGGATASEDMSVTAIRTLLQDPSGRYTVRHFPDVNAPAGTRKHSRKSCVIFMGKKERKGTKHRCTEFKVLVCPLPCF